MCVTEENRTDSKTALWAGIGAGIALLILLAIIIPVAIILSRRKKYNNDNTNKHISKDSGSTKSNSNGKTTNKGNIDK